MLKAFRATICASLLSISLSGCVSLSEFFAAFGFGNSEALVELPAYRVGDSFTFGSPDTTWRAVAIDEDTVTWRSDQGDEQVTNRNPLLPALAWRSERLGSGQRIISDKAGSLFPMKVGARTTFRAAVTTDKPPYGWSFDWHCEVVDRQDINGPTGALDVFKVGCGRQSDDEIVFYYAPSIGHYVTKTSGSDNADASRIRQLVAYEKINATGVLERVAFAGPSATARQRDRRSAVGQRTKVATRSPAAAMTTSGQAPRQLAALSARQNSPSTKPAEFYGLHLGTFLDPRKALRGWQHIYRSHEDVLAGLQPRIRRYDLGAKGVRYRLRVVPFVDEKAASAICERLEKRGKFCRVTLE